MSKRRTVRDTDPDELKPDPDGDSERAAFIDTVNTLIDAATYSYPVIYLNSHGQPFRHLTTNSSGDWYTNDNPPPHFDSSGDGDGLGDAT